MAKHEKNGQYGQDLEKKGQGQAEHGKHNEHGKHEKKGAAKEGHAEHGKHEKGKSGKDMC